jgi:hypothetical protein
MAGAIHPGRCRKGLWRLDLLPTGQLMTCAACI